PLLRSRCQPTYFRPDVAHAEQRQRPQTHARRMVADSKYFEPEMLFSAADWIENVDPVRHKMSARNQHIDCVANWRSEMLGSIGDVATFFRRIFLQEKQCDRNARCQLDCCLFSQFSDQRRFRFCFDAQTL